METLSALLAICAGNSPVPGEFPAQRPVTRIFNIFFDLHLNKSWVNNGGAGDLRRYRTHYDIRVMHLAITCTNANPTSIENSLINSNYTHLTIGFKNSLV